MIGKIQNSIASPPQRSVPKEYQEIAEGMESQFARHLIDEMKKSVPESEDESSSTEFYDSLLDEEYAQLMAKNSPGLGIKQMILDQIYPQQRKLQNNQLNQNSAFSGAISMSKQQGAKE